LSRGGLSLRFVCGRVVRAHLQIPVFLAWLAATVPAPAGAPRLTWRPNCNRSRSRVLRSPRR
jgi:hypothetical protein